MSGSERVNIAERVRASQRARRLGNLCDIQRILEIQPVLPQQDFLEYAIKAFTIKGIWIAFQQPSLEWRL
jgi:hypothetical protein